MNDCDALCLAYIRRFLDSVSSGVSPIERMDCGTTSAMSQWMQHIVDKTAPEQLTEYIDEAIAQLEQRVATRGTPEGRLITAVGQALNDMLGGPLDPLEVVFGRQDRGGRLSGWSRGQAMLRSALRVR